MGGGVFFAGNSSYVIDGVDVEGGYLVRFARFCDTFRDVLARGAERRRRGFADAEAFRGLQRFFGGRSDFSDICFHGILLSGRLLLL
jgi:hypothetical protein